MFELFKKQQQPTSDVLVFDKPLEFDKKKTTNELIEEIHESFFTEVDRLLEEAKIELPTESPMQHLIDKRDRLVALGFTNTKEVKSVQEEIDRLRQNKINNERKKFLISAINYFSRKYPNYKFITEDSVKRICNKYGLIYGTIDKYIGTVPDKNLKQMEEFKINENDEAYFCTVIGYWVSENVNTFIDRSEYEEIIEERKNKSKDPFHIEIGGYSRFVDKCSLEIAAPITDFDTKGMEVKDFKLQEVPIPDPIVLQPVMFKGERFYLVVTAWGLEASDEDVVNERMN